MNAVLERAPFISELLPQSSAVTPETAFPRTSSEVTPRQVTELMESILPFIPWATEQVKGLTDYGPNWDGYNALPVSKEALALSIIFLAFLKVSFGIEPPDVNPVRDGGISIEWDDESRYLEIELAPPPGLAINYLFEHDEDKPTICLLTAESVPDFVKIMTSMFSK